jgi:hypothetical protein
MRDDHKLSPQALIISDVFHLKCDMQQKRPGSTFRLAVEFFSVDAMCNKEPDWLLVGLAILSPWARDLSHPPPADRIFTRRFCLDLLVICMRR